MTEEEKKVAHMMYHHQGEKPEDIAEFFGHHQSCICKFLPPGGKDFPKERVDHPQGGLDWWAVCVFLWCVGNVEMID